MIAVMAAIYAHTDGVKGSMKRRYLESSLGRRYKKAYGCISIGSVKLTTTSRSADTEKAAAASKTSLFMT